MIKKLAKFAVAAYATLTIAGCPPPENSTYVAETNATQTEVEKAPTIPKIATVIRDTQCPFWNQDCGFYGLEFSFNNQIYTAEVIQGGGFSGRKPLWALAQRIENGTRIKFSDDFDFSSEFSSDRMGWIYTNHFHVLDDVVEQPDIKQTVK